MDGGGRGSTLWGVVAPGLRLLLKPCLTTSPRSGGSGVGVGLALGTPRNGMTDLRRSLWDVELRHLTGTHLSPELSAESRIRVGC